jgi:hypothetical protein
VKKSHLALACLAVLLIPAAAGADEFVAPNTGGAGPALGNLRYGIFAATSVAEYLLIWLFFRRTVLFWEILPAFLVIHAITFPATFLAVGFLSHTLGMAPYPAELFPLIVEPILFGFYFYCIGVSVTYASAKVVAANLGSFAMGSGACYGILHGLLRFVLG